MQAYRINEGPVAWFVRGTDDPDQALEVLLREFPVDATDHVPGPDENDLEYYPIVERAGLFRFNVCAPGDDFSWMLGYAKKPGRGVFPGVLLDVGWREISFVSDLPEPA